MDHALGWLSGEFYFDGQSLRDIMTEIGRWYNLNVVFAEKNICRRNYISVQTVRFQSMKLSASCK